MNLYQWSVVVIGDGFTPQNFNAAALHPVITGSPTNVISTPVVSNLDFASGLHFIVLANRFEVRQEIESPPANVDAVRLLHHCLALWPLVRPTAIGLNFTLGQPHTVGATADAIEAILMNMQHVRDALRVNEVASEHSFQFAAELARVTLKLSATATLPGGVPGVAVECNVNIDAPLDVDAVLGDRDDWLERCQDWSERLVGNIDS